MVFAKFWLQSRGGTLGYQINGGFGISGVGGKNSKLNKQGGWNKNVLGGKLLKRRLIQKNRGKKGNFQKHFPKN